MKKIYLLFIPVFCLLQNITAQVNLITNGSFEIFTPPCPTTAPNGAFIQVANWKPANDVPGLGSPHCELYCGGPNYGGCIPGPVPNVGSDGVAYCGFHTRIYNPPYNESIYQELLSPLIAGQSYTITFELMDCQSGFFTNGSSDFCVYTNVDTIIPACPVGNPTVVLVGCVPFDSISNTVWKHHSITFIAPPNSNVVALSGAACNIAEVYYYLDNVVLTQDSVSAVSTAFASSDTLFCANQCLDFFDLSVNAPTSWEWHFTGATPDTSSLQNPTSICYNNSGSYDVTLIACNQNGCDTLTLQNFISVDAMPQINLGSDTLICMGDSITLDAGAGFTSYLWSDNSTNQSLTISTQGTYAVEITSGACATSDTINVGTKLCSPFISLASSDTDFCEKQCLDFFDLSTNNPTSWQWFFPGADSLTSSLQNPASICYNSYGSFDVTLIACNQYGCDTLILANFITEYQNPVDSIYQSNDTLFSLPAYSYQWYEITNGIIAGANDQYFIPQQGGSYYCIVTDSIGCAGSSGTIAITAVNEWSINNGLWSIQPNPFHSTIAITITKQNAGKASFTIKNILGKSIFAKTDYHLTTNSQIIIDLASFSNGVYFLEMEIDGVSTVRKIVKE